MYNKINNSTYSNQTSARTSKTNLYIKGLPIHFNDILLQQLVPDECVVKSVKAAMDEEDKCKGYGFIDFVCEESAIEAKRHIEMNYSTYPVKFAKENEKDRTNLYVTNIPKDWTNNDNDKLKRVFEKYGEVQSAFIMQEKTTNKTTGIGFVRFSSEHDAEIAIEKLETNKIHLPDCHLPLEAKYADKHNPETRKRRNVDGNLKSYPFHLVSHSSSLLGDIDEDMRKLRSVSSNQQDLLSIYPTLLSAGNNNISHLQNMLPYGLWSSFNVPAMSNSAGLWNINTIPYLTNDLFSSQLSHLSSSDYQCAVNPFLVPTGTYNPFNSAIPTIDYCNNKNYVYHNNHMAE